VRVDEGSAAEQDIHSELGQRHGVVQLADVGDGSLHPGVDCGEAVVHRLRGQSPPLCSGGLMGHPRRLDQRLARHAAVVQAVPTQLVFVD
jgi:hypothetical protein